MRTLTTLLAVAALAAPVAAQQHDHPPAGPPPGPHPMAPQMMRRAPMAQGMMRQMAMAMPLMMETHVFGPQSLLDRKDVLGLTDQQVQRLTQLQNDAKTAHDRAQEQAHTHFQAAQQAWDGGNADQVSNHVRAGMQAMQDAHLAMLSAATSARAVLTAEQRDPESARK